MERDLLDFAISSCAEVSVPSQVMPAGSALGEERVRALAPLREELDEALRRDERDDIAQAVCAIRAVLGAWQGSPEVESRHVMGSQVMPEAHVVLPLYKDALARRIWNREPWRVHGGSTRGEDQREPLRRACQIIEVYMLLADLDEAHADQLEARARQGLDWLVSVQHQGGQFPYPDLSARALEWMTRCKKEGHSEAACAQRLPRVLELAAGGKRAWRAKGSPEGVIEQGWFVDVSAIDPGGLQFDTGVCGATLVRASQRFPGRGYLEAARLAGLWASAQRNVSNWNYNAFSAHFLALLAQADPDDPRWKSAALGKVASGVLPGLMSNGRWFDPHNARMVYHMILTRALLLATTLTEDEALAHAAELAVGHLVEHVMTRGATAIDDGIEVLVLARARQKSIDERALAMMLDAGLPGGKPGTLALIYWLHDELAPR